MPALKLLVALLAVAIGAAAVVAGGADDSPGLQGLGLVIVVGTLAFTIRGLRRTGRRRTPSGTS